MYAVIEPGSSAWADVVRAVEQNRKLTVEASGPDTSNLSAYVVKVKVGEGMWTPPISGSAR